MKNASPEIQLTTKGPTSGPAPREGIFAGSSSVGVDEAAVSDITSTTL